jgi:hypothetical protein
MSNLIEMLSAFGLYVAPSMLALGALLVFIWNKHISTLLLFLGFGLAAVGQLLTSFEFFSYSDEDLKAYKAGEFVFSILGPNLIADIGLVLAVLGLFALAYSSWKEDVKLIYRNYIIRTRL